jgi:hypothetical protein
MKSIKIVSMICLMSLMLGSCQKSNPSGGSNVAVRMTDAPGNFGAVYVDVQSVAITGNSGGEVMLNIHPGVYNLLDFTNGIDTLLATGTLNVGSIEQIRLILGSNNTVVVDGNSYPLSTPSAQQSGLKIQVHQTLQAGVSYTMLLDFDAQQSIVLQGNGSYQLKPVIRAITTANSGSIKGNVTPIGLIVSVTAISGGVSYSTFTNANGQFLISGVPAGIYSVTLTPSGTFTAVTIPNVVVATGNISSMGTINF